MMKKTILIAAALISVSAAAQNRYDALNYSQNNYAGTARTIAMGNAFTALGGDIGSIGINPAGSAVNNYSTFAISPGLNMTVSTAQGTSLEGAGSPFCFDRKNSESHTSAAMPNIGVSIYYDLHNPTGVKSWSLGIVANTTNYFRDRTYVSGAHNGTSIAGCLASQTDGTEYTALEADDAYESCNWNSVLGYNANMFTTLDSESKSYIGATEKYNSDGSIYTAGTLDQVYGRDVKGNKTDIVFNAAMNISDKLFLGANLGMISLDYDYYMFFKESAQNTDDFYMDFTDGSNTCFDNLQYQYNYTATGSGIYGKIGAIYTPNRFLRLGAAVQTPTATAITENWQSSAQTYFTNSEFDGEDITPEGAYEYNLVSPARYNFGLAVNYGMGVVSVDYELADYSMMKFKSFTDFSANSEFQETNNDISSYMGAAHSLRCGVEYKPIASFSIRGGYTLNTSPERYYDDFDVKRVAKYNDQSFSAGVGYSSPNSFFADFAVRALKYHNEYIYPYDDYIFDENGNVTNFTPEILNSKVLFSAVFTLGLRF